LNLRTVTPAATLAPEARIVLHTAGGADQNEHIEALVQGPVDWLLLQAIATQQRANRALARRLAELETGHVPDTVLATLRPLTMVSSFRQLHLEQRLFSAIDVLQTNGIRVLLLKGAALALSVYESFEDRPMGDVDLLVDSDHAVRAQQLLLANGWQPVHETPSEEFYSGHHHLPPLEDCSGTGIGLEIHTDLFFSGHPFQLSVDDLWAQAEHVPYGTRHVSVPSTTHLLLHLCTHFAWAHMARSGTWRAFRDLHAIESRGGIDWDAFGRAARDANAATSCYWTLRLARDLSGLRVPPSVLEELAPPYGQRMLNVLTRHLALDLVPSASGCPSLRMSRWMWLAAIRPGWSGHGDKRPWQRSRPVTDEAAALQAEQRRNITLRDRFRRLGRLRSYLSVLAGSGTAPGKDTGL